MSNLNLENASEKDIRSWAIDLGLKKLAKDDDLSAEDLAKAVMMEAPEFEFDKKSLGKELHQFLLDNGFEDDGTPPKWVATARKKAANGGSHSDVEEDEEKPAKKASKADDEDEAPKKAKGKKAAADDDEEEKPAKKAKGETLPAKVEVEPLKLSKDEKAALKEAAEGVRETWDETRNATDKVSVDGIWKLGLKVKVVRDIVKDGHLIATLKELFDNDNIPREKRIHYSGLNDCFRVTVTFKGKRELLEGMNASKIKSLLTATDPVALAEKGIPDPENPKKKLKVQDRGITADIIRKGVQRILNPDGTGSSNKGRKMKRSHVWGYFRKLVSMQARVKKFIKDDDSPRFSASDKAAARKILPLIEEVRDYITANIED